MLNLLTKVLSIAFKPLLDISKDELFKITESKRKIVKELLRLYENLENVEYHSKLLIQEMAIYIADDRIAWTVVRNKKIALASRSEELKKAANELGQSLKTLYWILKIQDEELLGHLVGISQRGNKKIYTGRILAIPQIVYHNGPSREGSAMILVPIDKIVAIDYNLQSLTEFYHYPEKVKKYLIEIDLDNKEKILQMVERTLPLLLEIGEIREMLKEFIKRNFSIEDFFK